MFGIVGFMRESFLLLLLLRVGVLACMYATIMLPADCIISAENWQIAPPLPHPSR